MKTLQGYRQAVIPEAAVVQLYWLHIVPAPLLIGSHDFLEDSVSLASVWLPLLTKTEEVRAERTNFINCNCFVFKVRTHQADVKKLVATKADFVVSCVSGQKAALKHT